MKECEHVYRTYRIGTISLELCRFCKQPKPDYWKPFNGIPNPKSYVCEWGCDRELPLAIEISIGYPGAGFQFWQEGKALAIHCDTGVYHCYFCKEPEDSGK